MTVEQDAAPDSTLDSLLTVLDASGRVVAFDDDSDPKRSAGHNPRDSVVRFPLVAGGLYHVRASAFPNPGGDGADGPYTLSFAAGQPSTDRGTFAGASPVDLGAGFARVSGTIGPGDDQDVYRFTAPAAETVYLRLDPAPGSAFQGDLFAFDDSGRQVATDYNNRLLKGSVSSSDTFNALPGQTYYVQVASFRGGVGGYDLRVSTAPPAAAPPAATDATFTTATPLTLDASGTDTLAGATNASPGAADVYTLVAPATGDLTVRMFAAPGSRLDPYLFSFTDSGSGIARSDDADVYLPPGAVRQVTIDRNSVLTLHAEAGKTYYLKATGVGSSTGAYDLAVSPAASHAGDQIGDARTLDGTFDPNDPVRPAVIPPSGVTSSALVMPGDLNAFQFTADVTGLMTVTEAAAPGGGLDGMLYAFDGTTRGPLAANNDSGGSYDSRVEFNVVAGRTYFLKAGGYGTSFGGYVLTLGTRTADASPGSSFATATTLPVSATDTADVAGAVRAPGGAGVYLFTAHASGLLTVRERADRGGRVSRRRWCPPCGQRSGPVPGPPVRR